MFNQVILIGKVKEVCEIKETINGFKFLDIIVDVQRNYKNQNNEYDIDTIKCTMWKNIAEHIATIDCTGKYVFIKGRIQVREFTNQDGKIYYNPEILVDKISVMYT